MVPVVPLSGGRRSVGAGGAGGGKDRFSLPIFHARPAPGADEASPSRTRRGASELSGKDGTTRQPRQRGIGARVHITYTKVVHLSHVVAADIPRWPDDPAPRFEIVAERATHGYFLRRLTIGEHSATHVNAPLSFRSGAAAIDAYAAQSLVAPAVLLDVRAAAARDADYLASPADLAAWEAVHGRLPAGSVVLLHTGWASRWNDPAAFLNAGSDGRMHFPGISPALADALVAERAAAGVGIDTHGVDGGLDGRFRVNARLLDSTRLVLENLANLEQLPPTGSTLVVGVLRLQGGSGSPAAVLALVP